MRFKLLMSLPLIVYGFLGGAVCAEEDDKPFAEAHIVLHNPQEAGDSLSAELLALCKQNLAPYKYPRWFQFVSELPKTATGKIQRFKLR